MPRPRCSSARCAPPCRVSAAPPECPHEPAAEICRCPTMESSRSLRCAAPATRFRDGRKAWERVRRRRKILAPDAARPDADVEQVGGYAGERRLMLHVWMTGTTYARRSRHSQHWACSARARTASTGQSARAALVLDAGRALVDQPSGSRSSAGAGVEAVS